MPYPLHRSLDGLPVEDFTLIKVHFQSKTTTELLTDHLQLDRTHDL